MGTWVEGTFVAVGEINGTTEDTLDKGKDTLVVAYNLEKGKLFSSNWTSLDIYDTYILVKIAITQKYTKRESKVEFMIVVGS